MPAGSMWKQPHAEGPPTSLIFLGAVEIANVHTHTHTHREQVKPAVAKFTHSLVVLESTSSPQRLSDLCKQPTNIDGLPRRCAVIRLRQVLE